jgi:hypothetical protein
MTERRGIQIPVWCSAICRNAFNEKCVEECSVRRDCSYFEDKPNLKLSDMPGFPLKESESMTKEEKFTSVTIYLAKVVDHLQGKEHGEVYVGMNWNNSDYRAGHDAPANRQIKYVLESYKKAFDSDTTEKGETK